LKYLDKIKRHIAFRKYFTEENEKFTNEFHFLPTTEIEKRRTEKLKTVLYRAVNTVPFYRSLQKEIDFENFTLLELKKFPIVNKEMIRSKPKEFTSTKYRGIASNTSGSTGIPFEFLLPYESSAIELMTANRAWGMGKEYTYHYKDPVVNLRSYSPKKGEPLTHVDLKNNYWYISPFHINVENLDQFIRFIEKSKSKILRGYPSSLYIFTLLLIKNNIKLSGIRSLITSSESLLPKYREVIEGHWGIKVLDWYGQNENTVTVQQCWAGNYHNNDDYGIIEIAEDHNIIATSLNNYVMPFIRYNTNDKAILNEETITNCPCGRNVSIPFKGILGRNDDILKKNDGTLIPTANFSTAMKYYDKLNQFQIIQNADNSVMLNLVIEDVTDDYIEKIKSEVYQRLGDVKLEVRKVKQIERDARTGKVKVSVQNY